MICRFIAAKEAEYSIKTMCRVLRRWLGSTDSRRLALGLSRLGSQGALGEGAGGRAADRTHPRDPPAHPQGLWSPHIHAELRLAGGVKVGRKRVERLMRQAGISGLIMRRELHHGTPPWGFPHGKQPQNAGTSSRQPAQDR